MTYAWTDFDVDWKVLGKDRKIWRVAHIGPDEVCLERGDGKVLTVRPPWPAVPRVLAVPNPQTGSILASIETIRQTFDGTLEVWQVRPGGMFVYPEIEKGVKLEKHLAEQHAYPTFSDPVEQRELHRWAWHGEAEEDVHRPGYVPHIHVEDFYSGG